LVCVSPPLGVFLLMVLAACQNGPTPSVTTSSATAVPQSAISFAPVASAPTALPQSAGQVSLPTIAGLSNVGGANGDHLTISNGNGITAVVTLSSSAQFGSSGGPPALKFIGRRGAMDINGTPVTPLYAVGVTNTGNAPQQVDFQSLTLGTPGLPQGASVGLAHYDPGKQQNGWNMDCAFGPNQVSQSGNNTTFSPNANITIYPGATLYFAPYAYPSSITSAPTPPPAASPVPPTVTPPPSLTGTYVGSAQQITPSVEPQQYVEFDLTQSGSSLSGTLAVVPNGPNQGGFFGNLSGTVSGSSVTINATPTYGDSCGGTFTGTAAGTLISGTVQLSTSGSCSGGTVNFSATLQPPNLPSLAAGTYTGTISDSVNGPGTLTLDVTTGGTVYSGTATVSFTNCSQCGGSNAFVGFVTNSTTGFFAIIPPVNSQQSCNPNGTFTINGKQLSGNYQGSGGNNGSACNGTGTFSVSSP
jgi:hypothetical protein